MTTVIVYIRDYFSVLRKMEGASSPTKILTEKEMLNTSIHPLAMEDMKQEICLFVSRLI